MSIYGDFLEMVSRGIPFKVDFKKKNMKAGNIWFIKEGEWDIEKDLIKSVDDMSIRPNESCLSIIEILYKKYKYSTPSEKSEKCRSYFYALPADKLSDAELVTGENRQYTRAALEGFILCAILEGWLVWNEHEMGKWFWQSKNDKDLVILREWIEN